MMAKHWLILLALIFAVAEEINSACVCNEKGVDACGSCSGVHTVKPKQKYAEKPKIPLPPIGDSCSCSKVYIEPVALPTPLPKYHKTPTPTPCDCRNSKSSYDVTSIPAPSPSAYYAPQGNYLPPAATPAQSTKDDSVPADPISISLAMQAIKAVEVPEAKLAYGFVQKPIDGLPKVYHSSIEEENLYALKNDVITLKKSYASYKQPEEEYDVEADDEETVVSDDEENVPALTYKQLGYVQEQFKNPHFQIMAPTYTQYAPNRKPVVVPYKVATGCGYRPDRVPKYEQDKNACMGGCINKMY